MSRGPEPFFRKTAVLGVGLIGASFALDMKKRGCTETVCGFGRNRDNLERARQRGVIDCWSLDPAEACADADLVMLAAPVGSLASMVAEASAKFKEGAIVTDAGSVKGELVYALERLMPEGVFFVGGHPIAGGEKSGVDAATEGLFMGAACIITPTCNTDKKALSVVESLWETLGAKVSSIDPHLHDRIYGAVSHMPHLIAYAMMNAVADVDPEYFRYCGRGFRDMTRIAASSPEMWRDICIMNRENLLDMISVFQKNLEAFSLHLRAADSDSLESDFRRARTLRENIGQN